MEQHHETLTQAGIQVIAVAMGEPKHAQRYCGSLAPHLTCLAEKTSAAHRAYGLARGGLGQFINANVAKNGAQLMQVGALPGEVVGDPLMMPGDFLIDSSGIVRRAFYSRDISDHPSFADILAAARELES